jgi:hypothetical protein
MLPYFITPTYSVSLNPKTASSSIARRIIQVYHPNVETSITTAAYPEGKNPDNINWHGFCPSEKTPSKPVALLVRNPVERFLSGVAYLNLDIDDAINSLANNTPVKFKRKELPILTNVHFDFQHLKTWGESHVFKLEEHLNDFVDFLQLGFLPTFNQTNRPKPVITEQQKNIIESVYAEDISFYNSIVAPNTVIMAPDRSEQIDNSWE